MPKLTLPSCVRPAPEAKPAPTLSHEEGLAHADKALAGLREGKTSREVLEALNVMVEATLAARNR